MNPKFIQVGDQTVIELPDEYQKRLLPKGVTVEDVKMALTFSLTNSVDNTPYKIGDGVNWYCPCGSSGMELDKLLHSVNCAWSKAWNILRIVSGHKAIIDIEE